MPSFVCGECRKSLSRKQSLANHLRLHRQKKITKEIQKNKKDNSEFLCALCWEFFGSQLHLKQHTELTHKKKRFQCTVCTFSTDYKRSLKAHDAAKHRPEYKRHRCRHCGASFVSPSHLHRHEPMHTRQFPATCTQCGRGCYSERDLRRHLPTHKKKSTVGNRKKQGGVAFKCGKCLEVFSQSDYLKQHVAKKHPTTHKKFPCGDCDFATDRKSYLWRHRQCKHLMNIQKKFQCHQCGKGFRSRSELHRHLRVHTREKPFACDDCRMAFTQKSDLVRHIRRVHLALKPFKCRDCGKTFTTKREVICHQERKKGEKVICPRPQCGIQLANKWSLKDHLHQMHGDQPMFRCGVCGQGLAFKSSLKRHQESHLAKPVLID